MWLVDLGKVWRSGEQEFMRLVTRREEEPDCSFQDESFFFLESINTRLCAFLTSLYITASYYQTVYSLIAE